VSYSELMGLASPYAHMLRDLHGALEVRVRALLPPSVAVAALDCYPRCLLAPLIVPLCPSPASYPATPVPMGRVQAVDGAKEVLGVPQELRDWIFDHVVRLKHRAQVRRPTSLVCLFGASARAAAIKPEPLHPRTPFALLRVLAPPLISHFYTTSCLRQAKADMKDLVSMVRAAAPAPGPYAPSPAHTHAAALAGPRGGPGPVAHTPVSRAVQDAEEMLAAMRRCVRALFIHPSPSPL
jgi:hypothetical protein